MLILQVLIEISQVFVIAPGINVDITGVDRDFTDICHSARN